MTGVQFVNRAPNPLVLAVWQTPQPPGPFFSVCWMRLPAQQGQTTAVQWDDELTAALAVYYDELPIFEIHQQLSTMPGQAWDVVTESGATGLVKAGRAPSEDVVRVANAAAQPVNPGLAQSRAGMYFAHNLMEGEEASFPVAATMTAGLFAEMVHGEVIDPLSLLAPPVSLAYPPGLTTATVTAVLQSTGLELTVTYGA